MFTSSVTDPFLDELALKRLTGRSQKSRQIAWLSGAGIPFRVNATGHPVVLWTALEGKRANAGEGWRPRALEA